MSDACLVCREVAGEIELPGGLLWSDEQAIAFHVMPTDENPRPYLGHCMVVTVRHVDHLGDLTEAEVESVARASSISICSLAIPACRRVPDGPPSMSFPMRHTGTRIKSRRSSSVCALISSRSVAAATVRENALSEQVRW